MNIPNAHPYKYIESILTILNRGFSDNDDPIGEEQENRVDLLAQIYIKICRLFASRVVFDEGVPDDSRSLELMNENEKLHYTSVYMLMSLFEFLDSAPNSDSIRIRAYRVQALVFSKFLFILAGFNGGRG
jgi:hypothetical protein